MTLHRQGALSHLDSKARAVDLAKGYRDCAVIDAALAGASQREIAQWARLSVNTIRKILTDAGVQYEGIRYVQERSDD